MKQHLTSEEGFEVSLIDTLIVSYFKGFVKRFFTFFFLAFPSLCGGTSLPLDYQRNFSQSVWWYSLFPLTPLLYHTLRGLSRGFSNFFSERPLWDLNPSARSPAFNHSLVFPLDTLIVSYFVKSVKYFINIFIRHFAQKFAY